MQFNLILAETCLMYLKGQRAAKHHLACFAKYHLACSGELCTVHPCKKTKGHFMAKLLCVHSDILFQGPGQHCRARAVVPHFEEYLYIEGMESPVLYIVGMGSPLPDGVCLWVRRWVSDCQPSRPRLYCLIPWGSVIIRPSLKYPAAVASRYKTLPAAWSRPGPLLGVKPDPSFRVQTSMVRQGTSASGQHQFLRSPVSLC